MNKEQAMQLLEITAQYVDEVQSGQKPRLSDYLIRYPRYADAIADFVAYYHVVEETIISTDAIFSTEAINRVSTLWAINCHSDRYDESLGELASHRAITTLLTTATGQRISLSQLAVELNLSRDIILLLEQRAIVPETIPSLLCEQIAMLLQYSSIAVQKFFCVLKQCQSRSAVQERKPQMNVAEESPEYIMVNQISFRSAVEASLQLSAEQRSHWDTMLATEGL